MKLKEPSMSLNLPSSARVARFWFLLAIGILVFHITTAGKAAATDNVVVQWNVAALPRGRYSHHGPPIVARALAIVDSFTYDPYAAHHNRAVGSTFRAQLRQAERQHP